MNFQPTAEHDMLRQSLATAFSRSEAAQGAERALVALDIFGLLVPETLGGSGLGMAEAVIVLHEAGKAGAGGELAARLLYAEAVARARPDLADAVLAGRVGLMAPVSGELSLCDGRLTGHVLRAEPAPTPEVFLGVPISGRDEIALLPAASPPSVAAGLAASEAGAMRYQVDLAQDMLERAAVPALRARLGLLRCAEMLGAADHAFAMALGYMQDRRQFGRPIGTNQALRHIAADCYVQLENARVAVDLAAAVLDAVADASDGSWSRADADKAVATALAYVPRTSREIVETAIHLHGGIGLTWDYGLNAPLRRIVTLGMAFGAPAYWRGVACDLYRAERQEERA